MKPTSKALGFELFNTEIRRTAFKFCFQTQLAPLHPGAPGGRAAHGGGHEYPGRAVQLDSIKARVESAYGFSA